MREGIPRGSAVIPPHCTSYKFVVVVFFKAFAGSVTNTLSLWNAAIQTKGFHLASPCERDQSLTLCAETSFDSRRTVEMPALSHQMWKMHIRRASEAANLHLPHPAVSSHSCGKTDASPRKENLAQTPKGQMLAPLVCRLVAFVFRCFGVFFMLES